MIDQLLNALKYNDICNNGYRETCLLQPFVDQFQLTLQRGGCSTEVDCNACVLFGNRDTGCLSEVTNSVTTLDRFHRSKQSN